MSTLLCNIHHIRDNILFIQWTSAEQIHRPVTPIILKILSFFTTIRNVTLVGKRSLTINRKARTKTKKIIIYVRLNSLQCRSIIISLSYLAKCFPLVSQNNDHMTNKSIANSKDWGDSIEPIRPFLVVVNIYIYIYIYIYIDASSSVNRNESWNV